jgi:hypothetical protein
MHKLKAKALTVLLLVTMIIAFIPLVEGSTGYITINVVSPGPSTPGQMVPAGGNVNLEFSGVGWSGGQFYLLMSKDGFSQISTGDMQYTPTFLLTDLTGAPKVINGTGGAQWTIGNNWVNGSIATGIPGGNYFIKAFDGTATSVAVTDTYITVIGAIKVVPSMGPGGQTVTITGSAFLANGYVNLSYYDQYAGPAAWVVLENFLSCNAIGGFNRTIQVVDFKQVLPGAPDPDLVQFMAMENGTGRNATATYSEYRRRLLQVGSTIATIGNATVIGSPTTGVAAAVIVAGNYFHPGSISLAWDGTSVLGTTTANQTGFFNTTITVPVTPIGLHNIVITDANINFVVTVNVTTTLVLTPNSGNVGITVTCQGYGYAPSTPTMTYNATIWWGATALGWGLVDVSGYFTTTIVVPKTIGGINQVMGLENNTAATSANATFTVTPKLVLTPDTSANDGTMIQGIGTGFDPTLVYAPNIDNNMLAVNNQFTSWPTNMVCNATGDLVISFIAAGFRPGLHVVSLYADPTVPANNNVYTPAVYATFNITTDGDFVGDTLDAWEPVILGIADTLATWEPVILGLSDCCTEVLGIATTMAAWEPVILGMSATLDTWEPVILGMSATLDTWEPVILDTADWVGDIKTDLSAALPLSVDMTPVWIAVVLSLIAALAAIYAVITIRQKIAG